MIEIIKEPANRGNHIPKLPKEVRQIEKNQGYGKIYMEEYVYQFLHEKPKEKEEESTYIFLREDYYEEDNGIFFIKKAFCIHDISYAEDMPVFSEDVWDEIYRKVRRYFPESKILGWAVDRKNKGIEYNNRIEQICRRHFAGEHKLAMVLNSLEGEEIIYVTHSGRYIPKEGCFVYFERNAAMQDYLTDYHIDLQAKQKEKYREKEIIATSGTDAGQETVARYRTLLQQQGHEELHRTKGLTRGLVPVAALVLVVLSAVLVQNYFQLEDMEQEVEALSEEQVKEQVLETVSNAAEEPNSKADGAVDEAASDGVDASSTGSAQSDAATQSGSGATQTSASTVNPSEDAVLQEVAAYKAQGYYVVQQGDQLTAISRKIYGTEDMVDEICAKNGISNMDHICAGYKLLLP